jgi:hypothetical protein
MSKKGTSRQPPRLGQRSLFGGFIRPRTDEVIQRDVMEAIEKADYKYLPPEILAGLTMRDINTKDLDICENGELPRVITVGDREVCSMTRNTFHEFAQRAMAAGFVAALLNYRKELAAVPALSRFYSKLGKAQRDGRESQSQRKMTRAEQAIAMAKAGQNVAEIRAHFRANGMRKCARSTVYRWLKVKRRSR